MGEMGHEQPGGYRGHQGLEAWPKAHVQGDVGFLGRTHRRSVLGFNCHLVGALESGIQAGHQPMEGKRALLSLATQAGVLCNHLNVSKDGELTALRARLAPPTPPEGCCSYSMWPMNTFASEEVETRKKPWKGTTVPSFRMKSTWRMENRMAPLLPESSSLAWEQEGTTSVDKARYPSPPRETQRLG